jgi:ribose 5-phosphate isomerase RpiB
MPEHPKLEGTMKIAVASDHAGPPLKEEVREDSKLRTFTSA